MMIRKGRNGVRNYLGGLRLNPLQTLSSGLFIISPFLSWSVFLFFVVVQIKSVRLLVDEYSTQATLWQISQGATGVTISPNLAMTSFYSGVLLLLGGLVSLRYFRIGFGISASSIIAFVLESYGIFGNISSGATLGYGTPGLGLLVATSGVVTGLVSLRVKKRSIYQLIQSLRTRDGLTKCGLGIALISLALDGANHVTLGQFNDFIGSQPLEIVLHLGFICGIPMLAILDALHLERDRPEIISATLLIAFAFILADGGYHFLQGENLEFIGHGSTEIILHGLTYYGMIIAVIARLFLKRG